jgi:hypothetical protein
MGSLTTFDRLIFKGHLTMLYPQGAFARLLSRQGVLLKDFKPYVQEISQQIKRHAQELAEAAGRPYRYLQGAQTARNGQGGKEGLARQIATEDEVAAGLICVLATLEPCSTFTVRGNRETHKLEVVRRKTKCLHFYFYYLDAELGFTHIRLQSWFPFQIQVYVNGRECLARHLDQQGIAYERYDNCFTQIDDLAAAQDFCEKFAHFDWPPVLNHLAKQVNPMLKTIRESGFRGYYWVADQCEIATDLMFSDRASLEAILPDLFEHAILQTACQDVLRFLGRKLHGNFKGEVTTSLKKRIEGWRAKHSMKRNSIKIYDKGSVLRIETTVNNPSEFRICHQADDGKLRWKPMRKGVSNLYRYAQVGQQANQRYLDHLAQAKLKRKAIPHLDRLCRSRIINGKRCARFNPLQDADRDLFAAVLSGEFALNGFRNRDLREKLYPQPPSSDKEARRRCTRTSRLIAKLRGHGLIAKVKDARLYRVTSLGSQVLFAVLSFYHSDFPTAFQRAQ